MWLRGSNKQNLKEIHAVGSNINDATCGRTTDGHQTPVEFQFHVKQS